MGLRVVTAADTLTVPHITQTNNNTHTREVRMIQDIEYGTLWCPRYPCVLGLCRQTLFACCAVPKCFFVCVWCVPNFRVVCNLILLIFATNLRLTASVLVGFNARVAQTTTTTNDNTQGGLKDGVLKWGVGMGTQNDKKKRERERVEILLCAFVVSSSHVREKSLKVGCMFWFILL